MVMIFKCAACGYEYEEVEDEDCLGAVRIMKGDQAFLKQSLI